MKKNMGMWVFLATEILLFGALIFSYQYLYYVHEEVFKTAAKDLHFKYGTINTILLLTGSYFVALAIEKKKRILFLVAMFLGLLFLGLKGYEYYELTKHGKFPLDFHGISQIKILFFSFYGFLTFLHAVHLSVGVMALFVLYLFYPQKKDTAFEECVGFYWHFVDMVWVFLYPLFYLVGHS